MADITFNTTAGQTIARELLIAYLNTSTTSSPTWSPIGKRVDDSSAEFDWQSDTMNDILGNVFTTFKKPTITQSFEPWSLDSGEAAQTKIWNAAVKDQDAQAMANMDMLIVHFYAGTSQSSGAFAERYSSCAIEVTGLGGEGGGNIGMPINVTYGGTRTVGTASKGSGGTITFTAASGSSGGGSAS